MSDIEFLCYDNRSCRYEDLIEELRATVEAQALQLEQARVKMLSALDAIDYTDGACQVNEPIGGVLPTVLIRNMRAWLAANAPGK
jgi:hypothetical protein